MEGNLLETVKDLNLCAKVECPPGQRYSGIICVLERPSQSLILSQLMICDKILSYFAKKIG